MIDFSASSLTPLAMRLKSSEEINGISVGQERTSRSRHRKTQQGDSSMTRATSRDYHLCANASRTCKGNSRFRFLAGTCFSQGLLCGVLTELGHKVPCT